MFQFYVGDSRLPSDFFRASMSEAQIFSLSNTIKAFVRL